MESTVFGLLDYPVFDGLCKYLDMSLSSPAVAFSATFAVTIFQRKRAVSFYNGRTLVRHRSSNLRSTACYEKQSIVHFSMGVRTYGIVNR